MDLEEVGVAPTTPAATALFVRLMGGNRDRSNGSASLLITSTRGCGKWTPKLSASFASKFFKVTFTVKVIEWSVYYLTRCRILVLCTILCGLVAQIRPQHTSCLCNYSNIFKSLTSELDTKARLSVLEDLECSLQ